MSQGVVPDPGTPATPAELAEKLRALRWWAGQPSLRRLRQLGGTRPAADGSGKVDALPVSTLSFVLRGARPASAELVRSFVTACLRARQREEHNVTGHVERWHEAWLVATGHATAGQPPEAPPAAGQIPRQRQSADEPHTDPEQLAVEPTIARDGSSPALLPPPAAAPQQLPRDAVWFTGRAAELEKLLALVPDRQRATAVVISAIDGMAGIGKTALAVHVAHQLVDRFPDGQLFIDLHGYTPGQVPIQPAEALARLLRDLGVSGTQIPAGLDARAGLYRTRLADQRMLIVLDNAATEAQVAPLLPGTPGCLVLVTSRRRLAGLDHTHPLSLDTLPVADAVTLFTQTVGEHRVADQPAERVAELVALCGRLPLAIQIAAARLRSHPAWGLADLVQRLRDQHHRLDELTAGQRSVAAALDVSYQQLSPDQQQAYRLLGAHPGVEVDVHATAALLDSTPRHASQVLEHLLHANLLDEPAPGRYRFHDLTRAHAAHTTARDEAESALGRLLDYYRHTAAAAMDTAYPYEREHRPQVPPAPTPGTGPSDPPAALAWLDAELTNLLAAARYAGEHGRTSHLGHLSTILHRHLLVRGRYHDAETLHQQALDSARAAEGLASQIAALNGLGDVDRIQGRYAQAAEHHQQALQIARTGSNRTGELTALNGLGWIQLRQGWYDQAADYLAQALQTARTGSNRTGELTALTGLGHIHLQQGRHEQAADHYQQALRIARTTGNRLGELDTLNGLGHTHRLHGRYAQAADHYQQALRIVRATGNRLGELVALAGLGHTHRLHGRYAQAADHFEQVLRIARATSHRHGELAALVGLGHINRRHGQYARAADHYQRLLELAQESSDRNWQLEAWHGLGRLRHATGHPDVAIAHHEQALTLARELNQPDDQARAHDGLAHAHHALHQPDQARRHWQRALNLLTDLGIDHTDDEEATITAIRAHLTALQKGGPQATTPRGDTAGVAPRSGRAGERETARGHGRVRGHRAW